MTLSATSPDEDVASSSDSVGAAVGATSVVGLAVGSSEPQPDTTISVIIKSAIVCRFTFQPLKVIDCAFCDDAIVTKFRSLSKRDA